MEYSTEHQEKDSLIVVKTRGQMNADDFLAMAEDILNCPAAARTHGVLFDHTELDFSAMELQGLKKIREYHRKNEERIGPGKSAILLASGMRSAWEELWSQGEKIQTANTVRLFESRQESLDWLKES